MTKSEREEREYKSLFTDERYAKKAWRQLIGSSLESAGSVLPESYDKDGNLSFQSQLDMMAYDNVKKRLESEGKSREPMQAELIVECNILKARFSDSTFNIVLDRTAGKVKDEITVGHSEYEDLTDEELNLLVEYREKQKANNEGE